MTGWVIDQRKSDGSVVSVRLRRKSRVCIDVVGGSNMRILRIVLLVLVSIAVIGTGLTGALSAKQAFDPKLAELIHDMEQATAGAVASSHGPSILDVLKAYRIAGYAGALSIAAGLALFVSSFTKRPVLIWAMAGASILLAAVAVVAVGGADRLGVGSFSPREHALTYAIPLIGAAVLAALAELCRLRIHLRAT
jgi:hypothetical protein